MKKGIFATIALLLMIAACSTDPPRAPAKTDQVLFKEYYAALMAKTDKADEIYRPFAEALEAGNLIDATSIAIRIKQPINSIWGEIDQLKAPALQNAEANKKLEQSHDAIAGAYLYKSSIVRDFIALAESPNIKKAAEIKNNAEKVQMLTLGGIAYLFEAGSMVGANVVRTKK